MSASRPLARSGVFRLRIAVSKRHFMKSTPTLSQARSYWTQSPAKPGSHAVYHPEDKAGYGKRVSLEVTDEASRSFQI